MTNDNRPAWDRGSRYAKQNFRNVRVHIGDEPLLTEELETPIIIAFRNSWHSPPEGYVRAVIHQYGHIVLDACVTHRTRFLAQVVCCNSVLV